MIVGISVPEIIFAGIVRCFFAPLIFAPLVFGQVAVMDVDHP